MERSATRPRQFTVSGKTVIIYFLAVIVIIVALLIWKAISVQRVEKKWRSETEALNKTWLTRMALPYSWAIRKEIMNGNIEEVNLYGNQLVREGTFSDVVIAGPDKKILSSTNKRFEGAAFSSYSNPGYLDADTATVYELNDSTLLLVSPVMGLNERIATVVIRYPLEKED